ncbi:hypothetical protein [Escherichia coli]|uniref:hypothetical protein n=1 Tax=Escherichia coli TaxID=562 RepID=UPI002878A6A6|nr:hypothetical protein [Escherichia coli]MDS1617146.1 hypothetical protein [Escherichia coli]
MTQLSAICESANSQFNSQFFLRIRSFAHLLEAGYPKSPNEGFRKYQRVTPYQPKSTSTVTEIVMVAGGLNHHYGDADVPASSN